MNKSKIIALAALTGALVGGTVAGGIMTRGKKHSGFLDSPLSYITSDADSPAARM